MATLADFERMDTSALAAKLEEITKGNEFLRKENVTLEAYLQRHVTPEEAEEWADDDGRRGRKKDGAGGASKGGKKGRGGAPAALTIDQKLDLVTAEQDALKKETTAAEQQSTRMIEALKAMLDQTDLRIASLKREAFEFKKEVVLGGQHPRTGKTQSEKVVRFFEEQIRAKDALADKLRLKNQNLRLSQIKLAASLKTKEEAGESLHFIDWHQLSIENKQALGRIEEKNNELLRLKLSTGQTIQSLNQLKTKLSEAQRAIVRLKSEMKARAGLLAKLQQENSSLADAVARAQEQAEAMIRAARASSELPTVLSYCELTALQATLTKELQGLGRRLEIAELSAHQATLKLQQSGVRVPSLNATVPPLPPPTTAGGSSEGRGGAGTSSSAGAAGRSSSAGTGRTTIPQGSNGSIGSSSADTRRSGSRLMADVDLFSTGNTGSAGATSGGGLQMATPARAAQHSASSSISSLSTAAPNRATPAGIAAAGGVGRIGSAGTGSSHTSTSTGRGSAPAQAQAHMGHSSSSTSLGRPAGGADTSRSPGRKSPAAPLMVLPKSIAGFGGTGRGQLKLGPATTRTALGTGGATSSSTAGKAPLPPGAGGSVRR